MNKMKEELREKMLSRARTLPYFLQKTFFGLLHKREYTRWKKTGKPLPPPRIIKENTIEKYLKSTGYSTLVETGTYRGDMIFAQIKKFKKIISIELDMELSRIAQKRFKDYRHVTIIQGDSAEKLQNVIDQIEEPVVFWLDGHYSGGVTALGSKVTPIFEELKIIFSKKLNHVILIDDARLFTGNDGYPTLESLKNFIFNYKPECEIQISDDCIQIMVK